MDGDELLTVDGVTALLKVGKSSVYRLIHRKELPPPVHLGRSARWRRKDVQRLVDRLRPGLLPPGERKAGPPVSG